MNRRILIKSAYLSIFLLLTFFCSAQTKVVDSLKKTIQLTSNNKEKLEAVFALCEASASLSIDTFYYYATLSKQLAAMQNDQLADVKANLYIGNALSKKGMKDTVVQLVDENLTRLQTLKQDKSLPIKFIILKGRTLLRANQFKEALADFFKALQIAETVGDTLLEASALTHIGWVNMEIGNFKEAINWFKKAQKTTNNPLIMDQFSVLYADLASCYSNIGMTDSALYYIKKSIDLATKNEILTALANALNIEAYTYINLKQYELSETDFKEALNIRRKIGDPFYMVSDMAEFAGFYAIIGQPTKGIALVKQAIDTAKKYKLEAKLPLLYYALGDNYKAAGDYINYSAVLEKIISLKDTLYQKNSAEVLADLQAKYDVQKKENTIIQQQLAIAHKNNWITGSFALLCITLVSGYFIFKYRKKKQLLEIQQLEIEEKRKTMHAIIHAEENERQRISSILHDSVAQKMVVTKLNLEAFEDDFSGMTAEQQKTYENIYSLVDESFAEVRNLSHTMMPKEFYESGLKDALNSFVQKIDRRKLNVSLYAEGNFEGIDKHLGFMIYRIIQECVQNAIKHARATQLSIDLQSINSSITVEIKDNGIGFDTEKAGNGDNIGIKTMQSRIDYLKGEITIESKPGNGTIVRFKVPVAS